MCVIKIKTEPVDDKGFNSMKDITGKSAEIGQGNVDALRERAQRNIAILDQLKHNRQTYINMFKTFSKSTIAISGSLEKIARRATLSHSLGFKPSENEVQGYITEINDAIDINKEFITREMTTLNHIKKTISENPDFIALDPVKKGESVTDKQKILEKLIRLDELRSQISERRTGSIHSRDTDMIDLKRAAEKYFI